MQKEVYKWLAKGSRRRVVLISLKQPMTAKQLSNVTGIREDCCSYVLKELLNHHTVICLNPIARRSRLYWLTNHGKEYQEKLLRKLNHKFLLHDFPVVDWLLYGWACYDHRSAVIKAITEPMKSSEIRRRVVRDNPEIKISTNNVSDIIQLLLEKVIIEAVKIRKKAHRVYRLTESGMRIRQLLLRIDGN